jgi:FKBP-type peptidyl-prolyl cis-trans isomerase
MVFDLMSYDWQEGIPGMQIGGIRQLDIPAALAYGDAGFPPNIPANADLVFEIKLVSIR